MSKVVLVLGGVKSGKSSYVLDEAQKRAGKTLFIATAEACDDEMEERIRLHQKERPGDWDLCETAENLHEEIAKSSVSSQVIVLDCIGLYITKMLESDLSDREIQQQIEFLAESVKKSTACIYIVSNEVGEAMIPLTPIGRRFQELVGVSNQILARAADEVIYMRAGIPVRIK